MVIERLSDILLGDAPRVEIEVELHTGHRYLSYQKSFQLFKSNRHDLNTLRLDPCVVVILSYMDMVPVKPTISSPPHPR